MDLGAHIQDADFQQYNPCFFLKFFFFFFTCVIIGMRACFNERFKGFLIQRTEGEICGRVVVV